MGEPEELRAKAPWFVSGTRTRHNAMPVLQIISEPSGEVLALVPYSDRTPKAHAECYADARLIAAAPDLLKALVLLRDADDVGRSEGYSGTMGADQRAQVDAALALAKARGEP